MVRLIINIAFHYLFKSQHIDVITVVKGEVLNLSTKSSRPVTEYEGKTNALKVCT